MTEGPAGDGTRGKNSRRPGDLAPLAGDALDAAVLRTVCAYLRNNEVRRALHETTRGADDAAIDESLARLSAGGAFHPVLLGFLIEQSLLAVRSLFEHATGDEGHPPLARHIVEDLAFGNGLRAALVQGDQGRRALSPLEESLVAGALELARRRGTSAASGE